MSLGRTPHVGRLVAGNREFAAPEYGADMSAESFARRGSSYALGASRAVSSPAVAARPAPLVDPALSPLVDRAGAGWVVSESRSRVLYLSPARRRFLAGAAAAGIRPILVTGESSVLTMALAEALQSLGGVWVVRSPEGYRDTRMGRRIASPEAALEPDADPRPAPEHVRRPESETTQITVLASIRQRNRRTAGYGGAFELLADLLVDDAALDWGAAEPAALAWDRARVAAHGREALAHNPWLVINGVGATGRDVTGTLRLRPTKQGAEEIVNLVADVGPEGSAEAAEALAEAPEVLAELIGEGVPLIAIAFGRIGRADLHRGPTFERPGAPLAILIGAPGVARIAPPLDELAERFGARAVGPRRTPSIVVPLGERVSLENVQRLREVLWALDPETLAAAIGPEFIDSLLGPEWRALAAAMRADDLEPEHLEVAADAP